MKLFIEGRREVWSILETHIQKKSEYVWFHVASLGEYEQGVPVIEAYKKHYPERKIILTFFSPSGYEIRKNNIIADLTLYLPLDTLKNAQRFLNTIQPCEAFFIKYEFWPNYLTELKKRNIPTYLISGIFRENQVFFKWYGGFYRNILNAFSHFFVQQESSKLLLNKIGFENISVAGDTRFDRVSHLLNNKMALPEIEYFKNNKLTVIIGSSWPEDEALWYDYINRSNEMKFIIAPHQIKPEHIQEIQNNISKKTVCYSNIYSRQEAEYDVLIMDNIGHLTKIYAYGDMAYVGGGFGAGIHNILEPATYGIPVMIGPKYHKFQEAKDLVALKSCIVIKNAQELHSILNIWKTHADIRATLGKRNSDYVKGNIGAMETIIQYLSKR